MKDKKQVGFEQENGQIVYIDIDEIIAAIDVLKEFFIVVKQSTDNSVPVPIVGLLHFKPFKDSGI